MSRIPIIVFIIAAIGCNSRKSEKVIIIVEEEPSIVNTAYQELGKLKLSEYNFFQEPISSLEPTEHVYPYNLNTSLFTDYALKKRFIFMPAGSVAKFQEKEVLEFPIGTILIKNFYYSADQLTNRKSKIIETRLLIHEESGWIALPYIWNDEQTEAFLEITGDEQEIVLAKQGSFRYAVPTMAQCKSCHEFNGAIAPIGPNARQLNITVNGKNQLSTFAEAGILQGLPELISISKLASWDNENSGSIEERSRAYLEINCGHCHRPEGPGKNSGLDLTTYAESDHALGIFKGPVAAGAGSGGLNYDIVPGKPEESILLYRMQSNDPGIMMPELGRKLIHAEGIELIKNWIKSMN